MRLTLKVKAYCDQPPADPQVRSFDTFPVILGRSSACDYSLNDASRYISSNHAVVTLEGKQLLIQDTSANGVYLNGASEPVGRGRSHPLNHADSLAIGDYIVIVAIDTRSVAAGSYDDPFDDFAGIPMPADRPQADAYDPFRGEEQDWTPPSKTMDDPFGDDWDMNDIPAKPQSPPAPAGGDWADWDTDEAAAKPAAPRRTASLTDPFALENDEFDWLPGTNNPTVSIPPEFPDNNRTPPRHSDRQAAHPGRRATPQKRQEPPAVAHSPHVANANPDNRHRPASQSRQPLDSLLQAASLRQSDFNTQNEAELLEQTGRLLAQMVDAMMVLLQSRAQFKNAMRSDVTSLSRSGNNPLKFSYSSADALTRLLANDSDGYLPADTAVQEAVDDLKLHQVAMLEGMKAAVRSLLLQFDPAKLAKKLEKTGGISANIPITREAKLWEMFCEQYDDIQEEAVSDFGEMFGAEFRKAYEKRIRQMGRKPEF